MLDLIKILAGHEGEIFYSDAFGDIHFDAIVGDKLEFTILSENSIIQVDRKGVFCDGGDCCVFPSRTERNWIKWSTKLKLENVKTLTDLISSRYDTVVYWSLRHDLKQWASLNNMQDSPLYKHLHAAAAIYELIDLCFGGIVTEEEWKNPEIEIYTVEYDAIRNKFYLCTSSPIRNKTLLAFKSKAYANEFFTQKENQQLVMDYYMYQMQFNTNETEGTENNTGRR